MFTIIFNYIYMMDAYTFFHNITPNLTFTLNDKPYTVTKINKDKSFNILINGKNKKVHYKYGHFYGTKGRGYDWFDQLYRDINGVILVDMLNAHNSLHDNSIFYTICNQKKH